MCEPEELGALAGRACAISAPDQRQALAILTPDGPSGNEFADGTPSCGSASPECDFERAREIADRPHPHGAIQFARHSFPLPEVNMFATCRTLLVVLGASLIGAPAARADDKGAEKPAKPQSSGPAKPIVIQIDASKLPPEVLKQLLQLSERQKLAPGEGTKKPGAEPVKPGLKPGVKPGQGEPSKPGIKPAQGEALKPGSKVIGLADAVAIAEKTAQGSAVRAERLAEDGTVRFRIELAGAKGGKMQLTIDASGKVTGEKSEGGEGEKGGGKRKKKQEG